MREKEVREKIHGIFDASNVETIPVFFTDVFELEDLPGMIAAK